MASGTRTFEREEQGVDTVVLRDSVEGGDSPVVMPEHVRWLQLGMWLGVALVVGRAGDDHIFTDKAAITAEGRRGNDSPLSWTQDDPLFAGKGGDTLDGGKGNDLFRGGLDNRILHGGDDVLRGRCGRPHGRSAGRGRSLGRQSGRRPRPRPWLRSRRGWSRAARVDGR